MTRRAIRSITRVQALVALLIVLAAVAGVVNYNYHRRPVTPAPSAPRPAALPTPPSPPDDRPRQIMALSRHLAQHPKDRAARFQLAHLYFQLHDYSHALAELRVLEREYPRDAEVPLRQAVVLKYDGRAEEAEKAVRRALALDPEYALAQEWLGEVLLDQGRLRDALQVFNRCLQKRPDSYFALLGKGRALEQLLLAHHPVGIEEVLAPVEKAVEQQPNNPEGLALLARLKFAFLQGEEARQEAEALALRAMQLDPEDLQPYITLAQIYLARPATAENMAKVAEYAYEAARRNPQDPRPPYLLGRAALFHKDLDRAIQALEQSLSLHPLPETVTQLAAAHRRAGNVEKANHYAAIYQQYVDRLGRRDALLGAREREPRDVRHYYALAELYLDAGQPEHAERWLKEARRLRPRDSRSDRLMARVRNLREKGRNGPLLSIP